MTTYVPRLTSRLVAFLEALATGGDMEAQCLVQRLIHGNNDASAAQVMDISDALTRRYQLGDGEVQTAVDCLLRCRSRAGTADAATLGWYTLSGLGGL